MKRVEVEALSKSFLLFFGSMGTLIVGLFYLYYQQERQNLDQQIILRMNVCSFSLRCDPYQVDFVPRSKQLTYRLYQNDQRLYALYPIKKSDAFLLRIYLPYEVYEEQLKQIQKRLLWYLLLVLLLVALLSVSFSIYALRPLKEALLLTREFIKDILHDLNTPISTMRLNLNLMERAVGKDSKIQRIERAIDTILRLQENLKHYLLHEPMSKERVNLLDLVEARVDMIHRSFPHLAYGVDIPTDTHLLTNGDALIRIVDNLLSNASKYNTPQGRVDILYNPSLQRLMIKDTGRGIKYPHRVFERFYKEQDRGVGIGLHIVKKLCDALTIKISIESQEGIGTTVILDF